jgi:hypothetical protein
MFTQSITIADRYCARARDEVDFIKFYIFPRCGSPAVSARSQAMANSSDLRIVRHKANALDDAGTSGLAWLSPEWVGLAAVPTANGRAVTDESFMLIPKASPIEARPTKSITQ